jgi:methylglutaconyl-CoA hydratase
MKLTILVALCCLILGVYASPIVTIDSQNQPKAEVFKISEVHSGRQTSAETGSAPVASPAVTDDDDDDDDDDDVDLDITEDDDDDDDDDESEDDDDDDDDDYFERFFDDILGGRLK